MPKYTKLEQVMTPEEKARFEQRLKVANLTSSGATYAAIEKEVGCSQGVIENVRRIIGLKR